MKFWCLLAIVAIRNNIDKDFSVAETCIQVIGTQEYHIGWNMNRYNNVLRFENILFYFIRFEIEVKGQ